MTRHASGWPSHFVQSAALALALVGVAFILPARAQTSAAKPTCAAGDPVVWENTSTKAYHLSGDKYFGNTKHGAYACKSAADSAGYHVAGAKGGSKMSSSKMGAATPAAMSDTTMPMTTASPTAMHHKHRHRSSMATPAPAPSPTGT